MVDLPRTRQLIATMAADDLAELEIEAAHAAYDFGPWRPFLLALRDDLRALLAEVGP